eukprot:s2058_g9.t1
MQEARPSSTDPNPLSDKSFKTFLKWSFPPLICALCFGFQSVMLHMTTVKYVLMRQKTPLHDDLGHELFEGKPVAKEVLDALSVAPPLLVIVSILLLRDVRLWAKVFFSNSILFVLKGLFDWMTVLPDSIGFASCVKRLNGNGGTDEPLKYLEHMGHLSGTEYFSALLQLELHGVGKVRHVRYCADMLMSGHTFVTVLYMLALADLVRRITILMSPIPRLIWRLSMGIFAALCVGADLYLIVKTRFHYTVDIVMAIVITLLIYTNAGMAVLAQWYASEEGKRKSADADIIWLPAILIPFCCLHGYYSVREMEDQQVRDLQAGNQSSAWEWLTELFTTSEECLSPEQEGLGLIGNSGDRQLLSDQQVQSYGSAQNLPKNEAESEGSV